MNLIRSITNRLESKFLEDVELLKEIINDKARETGIQFVTKQWLIIECVKSGYLSDYRTLEIIEFLINQGFLREGVYVYEIKSNEKTHHVNIEGLFICEEEP